MPNSRSHKEERYTGTSLTTGLGTKILNSLSGLGSGTTKGPHQRGTARPLEEGESIMGRIAEGYKRKKNAQQQES